MLGAIHALNRLENVGEPLRHALNVLAGVAPEGTLSQGIAVGGMRRSRYVGQAETHPQNVAIAAPLNVLRMVAWLMEIPLAKTQKSRFARLSVQAASSPA